VSLWLVSGEQQGVHSLRDGVVLPLIFLGLFGSQTPPPLFNSDSLFLSPRKLPGQCSVTDSTALRNREYTLLGSRHAGMPVKLRDGKAVERDDLGKVDWETVLVGQKNVRIGNRRAVILVFTSDHLSGTGNVTTILAASCEGGELEVVFEAEGEGIRHTFLPAGPEIVLMRPVWSSTDAHCCPIREATERYRWSRASGQFTRIGRVERARPRR
jgi:hypothetical protein